MFLPITENLSHDANNFQRSAVRLKRKLWWQNIKLWIILIIVILVILGVLGKRVTLIILVVCVVI